MEGLSTLFIRETRILTELDRTTFETPPLDGNALQDVFIKYGRSPRHCYKLAGSEGFRRAWEESIPDLLRDIPRISSAIWHGLVGVNSNEERIFKASSQLITVYPNDHRWRVVTLTSKHIASHFYNAVLKEDTKMFRICFDQFWEGGGSRRSAGWLWEAYAKAQLSTGRKRRVELICLPSTQSRTSDRASVDLPFSNHRTLGTQEQLATDLARIVQSLSSGGNELFVLGSRDQDAFGAFSISSSGAVDLFQITTLAEKRPKTSELDFLWDVLSRAQDLTDPAFRPFIEKLKPTKTRKWRLIFVIPKRVVPDWTEPRSIDFGGIKSKRAWGDYVEQFVMVLDDDGGDGETEPDTQTATTSQGTGRVVKRGRRRRLKKK